jgi:hypothetical protein
MMGGVLDLAARLLPALTGLALFWMGLFAALSRRRLDTLQRGLFVAGMGVTLLAASLGALARAPGIGRHVAMAALALALAQALAGLAVARVTAARLSVTRTDQLERLHG